MNFMDLLRKYKTEFFIFLAVMFTAGIFLNFGYVNVQGNSATTAAIVYGKKVPLTVYNRMLEQAMENEREKKTDLNEQNIRYLRQMVLNEIILQEVYWHEAKKLGLEVTDREVYQRIMSIPAFQDKEGRFNRDAYLMTVIRRLRMTPRDFEDNIRKSIATYKVRNFLLSGIQVTPQELMLAYQQQKGNMKNFEKDRESFQKELVQKKQYAVMSEWQRKMNEDLKTNVKILVKD